MSSQSNDVQVPLPVFGQTIEIRSAAEGTGYTTTVLHVSEANYVLVDLPPLGTLVSLRTPRNTQVIVRFLARDGSPVSWTAVVRSFGNWGVGLLFEQQVTASEAS